jgi:1,6-anhydro-N-acetylmuramate kinase
MNVFDKKDRFCLLDFIDCLNHATKILIPIDCIATLSAFTARAIIDGISKRDSINTIILLGKECKNNALHVALSRSYNVLTASDLSWDHNFTESQQYAFYALRRFFKLPNSFPSTTGVSKPVCCGEIFIPTYEKKSAKNICINARRLAASF